MAGLRSDLKWDAVAEGKQLFDRLNASRFGWVVEVDGRVIGHIRLSETEESQRRGRIAMGLLSDEDMARGYGRRSIALILDHLFTRQYFHRIDLRVLSYNRRAIRCYLACGFRFEGLEREVFHLDGNWFGDWIMGILEHEERIVPMAGDKLIT